MSNYFAEVPGSDGQTYTLYYSRVKRERPISVMVMTQHPEKGVCEMIYTTDGTRGVIVNVQYTKNPDGTYRSKVTQGDFEPPVEVAVLIQALVAGPSARRDALTKPYKRGFLPNGPTRRKPNYRARQPRAKGGNRRAMVPNPKWKEAYGDSTAAVAAVGLLNALLGIPTVEDTPKE